jgi:phage terminase large subunit GpA-like protein
MTTKAASISALAAVVSGAPVLAHRPAREMIDRVAARVFEVREKMSVSDWASKFRYIPSKISAAPGLIDLDKTPYLRGVLDAFGNPIVREIDWMKSVQIGGTTATDTMPLWAVCYDPGPALWMAPTATHATEAAKDRLAPSARLSPATRNRIGGGIDDEGGVGKSSNEDSTSKKIDFDVMRITFAGSGTKNSTIARAVKYAFIDDFDRCESYTYAQMTDRVSSFADHKIVCIGNPTFEGMGIAKRYSLSNRQVYLVPCWRCNYEHELLWKNLRWEGGLKAEAEVVDETAWMKCPKCAAKIENHHKPGMLRAGQWVAERPEIRTRAGFRINTLYSPFQRFGWMAKDYLDSGGRPGQDWVNNKANVPIRAKGKALELNVLRAMARAARGPYRIGVGTDNEKEMPAPGGEGWRHTRVPDECCVLMAGIDVQDEYVYVMVMGFSPYGLRAYFVDRFIIPVNEQLSLKTVARQIRDRRYQRMDGRWMRIFLQVWDTGHRAVDVYAVSRAEEQVRGHMFVMVKGQGSPTTTKPHWWAGPANLTPGTKAAEAGVTLLHVNTRQWKDRVAWSLRATASELGVKNEKETGEENADPSANPCGEMAAVAECDVEGSGGMMGAGVAELSPANQASASGAVMDRFFFPYDVPGDVLEHMSAERLYESVWIKVTDGSRNEAWDLAYYLAAVGDAQGLRSFGVEHLKRMITAAPSEDQVKAWGIRFDPIGKEWAAETTQREQERVREQVRKPAPSPVGVNGSARIAAVRAAMARRRSR